MPPQAAPRHAAPRRAAPRRAIWRSMNSKTDAPGLGRATHVLQAVFTWGIRFCHLRASAGIRFQKRGSEWASVFRKWASAEPKTLFWEGIKRNQFPLLKLKKATHQNTHIWETPQPKLPHEAILEFYRALRPGLRPPTGGRAGRRAGAAAAKRGDRAGQRAAGWQADGGGAGRRTSQRADGQARAGGRGPRGRQPR